MAVNILGLAALLGKDVYAASPVKASPGSVFAMGGNEDKTHSMLVLKTLLAEAKGKDSHVVIITTASSEPEARKRDYSQALSTLGVKNYTFIYMNDRDQAFDPEVCKKLTGADIVFFSGGDQLRLTALLGGTPFLNTVRDLNKKGTVVGGTSAGGAVLSDLMVYAGVSHHAA